MSKFVTMFSLILLLCSVLIAARPEPGLLNNSPANLAKQKFAGDNAGSLDDRCEGVNEEECLLRRTLVAHTDYIYTQKENP